MSCSPFLRHALELARRNQGNTGANPSVGCVLVKNNQVIAAAVTAQKGRPHAEKQALQQAGVAASGATAYVTLEPCISFPGKSAESCAEVLVKAGIVRLVVGMKDPHPAISGAGIEAIKNAGIEVIEEDCPEIRSFYEGEKKRHTTQRPLVIAKLATSLDGRMALKNDQSQWITTVESRNYGHHLRSRVNAIMTGIGTVRKDNPMLTCRIKGLEGRSPIRIVLDSHFLIEKTAKLITSASEKEPVWVVTTEEALEANKEKCGQYQEKNVRLIGISSKAGKVDIEQALKTIAREGVSRVLLESGPTLFTAALRINHVDQIYWFQSSTILGADAFPVAGKLGYEEIEKIRHWRSIELEQFGNDTLQLLQAPTLS